MRLGVPLVIALWSSAAAAVPPPCAAGEQEPSVSVKGPDPAVVKLGDAAEAVVTVSGSHDAEIVKTPEVAHLGIRVGPPQESSYFVSDGRRLQQTLSLSWAVRLVPDQEGKFEVPPIEVRVGRSTFVTKPMRIEAVRDLKGQEYAFLEVSTPKRTYFVHEPIHVSVRYGIDQRILRNLLQIANMEVPVPVQVRATWLAELPGAVAFDRGRAPEPSGERYKMFVNDTVAEAAHVGPVERQGRTFDAFELEKDYLPGRIGELEFSKPTLFFRYVTRYGTDMFRQRVPAEAESAFVYGQPLTLTIKPIPEEGRPADYTGGVGRFRLSVEATPKDLKVGESLKLTLTIEGEGNLEFLEPPRLDDLDGFHVFGKIEEKGRSRRTITYDISPLSEKVTRVPAISLSYFDTAVPGFKRVSTAPIPLVVRPLPEGAHLRPLPGESSKRAVPGVDDILDMKVAGTGTPGPPGRPGTAVAVLLILGPWLGAGAFWALLKKRERDLSDPARVRARAAAATFRRSVPAGGADPFAAFARYLADRLSCPPAAVIADDLAARLVARGIDADLARRAAAALHSHVEARYAGTGGVAARSEEFARLVEELETAFRGGR